VAGIRINSAISSFRVRNRPSNLDINRTPILTLNRPLVTDRLRDMELPQRIQITASRVSILIGRITRDLWIVLKDLPPYATLRLLRSNQLTSLRESPLKLVRDNRCGLDNTLLTLNPKLLTKIFPQEL
jgi:hypothetical protein